MMDFAVIAQAVTVGLLFWVGRNNLESSRLLAVHEEKHRRHDDRLRELETKATACPR